MRQIKTQEGDSVNTLLYRHYGRDDDQAEETLHQLNPHLVHFGPVLPAGLMICLPQLPQKSSQKVVQIWD